MAWHGMAQISWRRHVACRMTTLHGARDGRRGVNSFIALELRELCVCSGYKKWLHDRRLFTLSKRVNKSRASRGVPTVYGPRFRTRLKRPRRLRRMLNTDVTISFLKCLHMHALGPWVGLSGTSVSEPLLHVHERPLHRPRATSHRPAEGSI
jgi:hypothetical protein